jgi:hypothetical protein
MSEDTQVATPEVAPAKAPEYTPVEQAAMEKGWRPKEEYQGDPERWRSAEVFLALDEPLKRIEHQSKEMRALREALQAFKEHHTKVEASAFDRALTSLKAEKRQAILAGDTEKQLEIEDQVDAIKEQKAVVLAEARKPVVAEVPPVHPEFAAWQSKNSWYSTDEAMTAVADRIGQQLHSQGMSPAQALVKITERIKEEFPHKFKPAGASRAAAVEGSSRSGGSRSSGGDDLSDQERDIMRKIVRSGVMTEEQYKADLKKAKER